MAKRSKKRNAKAATIRDAFAEDASKAGASRWTIALPWILGLLAFCFFIPALSAGFVYDGPLLIKEGFFTNIANLPDVLTLKVLGMPLLLGDRPGQLLYLMLIALVWGTKAWGYHLCSNLLHAANAGLLFVLGRRVALEAGQKDGVRLRVSLAVLVMIFAVHPLAVETVANISYSSDLLATFFTLGALLAATAFKPDVPATVWRMGLVGAACTFAAVTCKESGAASCALLAVYWFLFRRAEPWRPWAVFIGVSMAMAAAFLLAHFLLAPPPDAATMPTPLSNSFAETLLIQVRLWVFMMGKIAWPATLSVDYRMEDIASLSETVAIVILLLVLLLQGWLVLKSRLGAMGVAMYWLGLAMVSNFLPLYRPVGDRFYYLPMAGVVLQLFALLLMAVKMRDGFWVIAGGCAFALVPLSVLTLGRESIFHDEYTLWSETVKVSPYSCIAHCDLGHQMLQRGDVDGAIIQLRRAIELAPDFIQAHDNLGAALALKGQLDDSIAELRVAVNLDPDDGQAYYNLGVELLQAGHKDEAMTEFQRAMILKPNLAEPHNNAGAIYMSAGRNDEALAEFRKAAAIQPDMALAHYNIGHLLMQMQQWDEAIPELQRAAQLDPTLVAPHTVLGEVYLNKNQFDQAVAEFEAAQQLNPNDPNVRANLAHAQAMQKSATAPSR